MNHGGWSWKRQVGISGAKAKISRQFGFPFFSRSGQEAWVGRHVVRFVSRLLGGR